MNLSTSDRIVFGKNTLSIERIFPTITFGKNFPRGGNRKNNVFKIKKKKSQHIFSKKQ
jgi:hypothetical protein